MASPERLAKLMQGVEAWNEWREYHPEVKVDLDAVDLHGVNLAEVDLAEVDLTGANLIGGDLMITVAPIGVADWRLRSRVDVEDTLSRRAMHHPGL